MATFGDIFPYQDEQVPQTNSPVPSSGQPDLQEQLRAIQSRTASAVNERMNPPDLLAVYGAQDAAMAQHNQWRQYSEQLLAQVERKQEDLRLAERIVSLFDENLSPAAKKYMFDFNVKAMGLNPRSDSVKSFFSMAKGISPEERAALRQGIVAGTTTMAPGELAAGVRGVLTGQLDPSMLFSMVSRPTMQSLDRQINAEEAEGAGNWAAMAQPNAPMARAGGDPESTGGQQGSVTTAAPESRTAHLDRQVPPRLAEAFGLDPSRPWLMSDIVARGWRGDTSEAEVNKFINDLDKSGRATVQAMLLGAEREQIARENPEALNVPLPFGGEFPAAPRVANEARSILRGVDQWALRAMGRKNMADAARDQQQAADETSPTARISEANQRLTGNRNQFSVAIAGTRGQSGANLSNQEAARAEAEVAGSSDPGTLTEGIRGVLQRAYNGYNAFTSTAIREGSGVRIPLPTSQLTSDQIQMMLNAQSVPEAFKADLRQELARQQGRTSSAPAQSAPVDPASASPVQSPASAPPASSAPSQSPVPAQQGQAPAGMNRAEMEAAERQRRQDHDRAFVQEQRSAFRAQQERLLRAEERDIERLRMAQQNAKEERDHKAWMRARAELQDAEQRKAKLSQLFAEIGKIIARGPGGGSVSSTPSMGSDQSPEAFQIGQRPQRQAPQAGQVRNDPWANVRRRRWKGDE